MLVFTEKHDQGVWLPDPGGVWIEEGRYTMSTRQHLLEWAHTLKGTLKIRDGINGAILDQIECPLDDSKVDNMTGGDSLKPDADQDEPEALAWELLVWYTSRDEALSVTFYEQLE